MPARLLDPSSDEDVHIDRRLSSEPVIWLGTLGVDGRPRHVPVWFVWDDPEVLIFSGDGTYKLRSIAQHPAVWLSLNAADDGNDVVLLEGSAVTLDAGTVSAAGTPAFRAKYESRMTETAAEWARAFPVPIRVRVRRLVAWSKPPSGPRYRVAVA